MDIFTGLLTKIKLIKEKPLFIRFTLITKTDSISCLIAKEILSKQLILLPDDKYTIMVKGYFDQKNQLVVKELRILDKDKFTNRLGL